MKIKLSSIFYVFILFVATNGYSKDIVLNGIFQGENIYVLNPFSSTGVGFCVHEITVNNKITTDEINSSAFEIDLSLFQLKLGDKLTIVIKHKENCLPKVLNPDVIKPKSTFKIASIKVEEDQLRWTTTSESGKLPFIVEQYRWNKWVKVEKIMGKGEPKNNSYSLDINLHSGTNKFRVKQIDYTKKPKYSKIVTVISKAELVTFSPKKVSTELIFTSVTMYEIFDLYGQLILKGFGSIVDVSSFKKGKYYINYDSAIAQFTKK